MRAGGAWTHACEYERSATSGRRHAGPGARLTLATLLGAADARVVESVEGDVVVLSDGRGLHEGANASTRIYDGERVWHLTFRVRERHELAPRQARSRLTLSERKLLGEERRLPRVACRLGGDRQARRRRRAHPPGRASSTSRRAASRCARRTAYGAGDLIDVDLDDGTGAVISARVEVVDLTPTGVGTRGRIVAVADDGAQRLGALVDRLRDSPSDGEPQPEPLPGAARGAGRRSPPARAEHGSEPLATLSAVDLSSSRPASRTGPGSPRSSPACPPGSRSIARRSAPTSPAARRATAAARGSRSSRTTSRSSAACATGSRSAGRSR